MNACYYCGREAKRCCIHCLKWICPNHTYNNECGRDVQLGSYESEGNRRTFTIPINFTVKRSSHDDRRATM